MKKLILAATALGLATMATAQDPMPAQQNPPGAEMPSAPPAGDMSAQPAPAAPDAAMGVTPPATDAAAPASPMATTAAAQPPAATTDYPPCSRTVTDKCVNRSAAKKRR